MNNNLLVDLDTVKQGLIEIVIDWFMLKHSRWYFWNETRLFKWKLLRIEKLFTDFIFDYFTR